MCTNGVNTYIRFGQSRSIEFKQTNLYIKAFQLELTFCSGTLHFEYAF